MSATCCAWQTLSVLGRIYPIIVFSISTHGAEVPKWISHGLNHTCLHLLMCIPPSRTNYVLINSSKHLPWRPIRDRQWWRLRCCEKHAICRRYCAWGTCLPHSSLPVSLIFWLISSTIGLEWKARMNSIPIN